EVDKILVGINGERIQPREISSGGNYNSETNKIKWNNISKDVVENYYFAKDIETGNIHGTFSGSVSQPIKYINNSQGNTDNNSDTNSNDKSDTKNNTSYTSLPFLLSDWNLILKNLN
ncbi:hypothetical protein GNF86_22175, partial [Clostridium perfringens]